MQAAEEAPKRRMGIFGLHRVQRTRLPADVIFLTDSGLERRRLQHGVAWAVGPLQRSGGERLMLPDGLMDKASMTCTTFASQEKHYLKWMTACKNVLVCV